MNSGQAFRTYEGRNPLAFLLGSRLVYRKRGCILVTLQLIVALNKNFCYLLDVTGMNSASASFRFCLTFTKWTQNHLIRCSVKNVQLIY